eukprot:RCo049230
MAAFDGAIGIALGNTVCYVAVVPPGGDRPEVLTNDQGNRGTPACVAFADKETLVGEAAKVQQGTSPALTVEGVLRVVGAPVADTAVRAACSDLRLTVKPEKEGGQERAVFVVESKSGGPSREFTPEQIVAVMVGKMLATAEAYLGKKVARAVVSVPLGFSV